MAFTNNRPEFRQGQSYTEELHAKALNEGIPSFVQQGLELTGTTLTSGVAINAGVPGQWGNPGETHTITANYTGYVILKTVLDGANGLNSVELSTTRNDTDPRSTEKTRYFTIYQLNNGTIVQDFRHINYVKSFYLKNMGGNNIAWVLNGFTSETFDASVLAGNRTILDDKDISYDDTVHGTSLLQDILKDIVDKGQLNVGNDKPFEVSFRCTTSSHSNLDANIDTLILTQTGKTITHLAYVFRIKCATNMGLTGETIDVTNKCYIELIDGTNFEFIFDYDNFANVKVVQTILKQEWSLDELGLDGTWSLTDVPGNIKKAYDKVVSLIGNKTPFTITQGLYRNSGTSHYEFAQAVEDSIVAEYGKGIGTTVFEFSITFSTYLGTTSVNNNTTNFIKIKSNFNEFTRQFDFDGWSNAKWVDEKGYIKGVGTLLYDTEVLNNQDNITLSESYYNFDRLGVVFVSDGLTWTETFDIATYDVEGMQHARFSNMKARSSYDGVNWTNYNVGLSIEILNGTTFTTTASSKYVTMTYIKDNGTADMNALETDYGISSIIGIDRRSIARTGIPPALLNQPITTPEVGDNMEETRILKEVIDNA